MKFALLPILVAAALFGQTDRTSDDPSLQEDLVASLNVNSRYTVESVDFATQRHYRLSSSVLAEMQRLVGSKLNDEAVKRLTQMIRGELRAHDVTFKLARGGDPGSVKVLLEVDTRNTNYDLSIPKFAYNSSQGWTAVGVATATMGNNAVSLGLVTDGDTLAERYSGFQAKYNRIGLGNERIILGFEFDAFHEQYNQATLAALDSASSTTLSSLGAGAYRSRLNFEPSATFVLAKPLTLTVGFSFEQLQPQLSAARSESANAVINSLRYHRRWTNSGATVQELDAGYNLRAATKSLGSDLGYTKHAVNARYGLKHDNQSVEVALVAGVILGQAPLFERFVLGNSNTLRGWNKFDIDPLGGNRVVHGSVTYGYHIMRVFYDAGAVWDRGQSPDPKHSVGIGISSGLGLFQKGAFLLAVAFPIRQGRADPVFIAGMNF